MLGVLAPMVLGALGLVALPGALAPVAAQQSFRVEVFNTRREISGQTWQGNGWLAFAVDEVEKSINGDEDADDTVLQLFNVRTLSSVSLGLALDPALTDDSEDWAVAISGDTMIVQVSEADHGDKDLNGNGRTDDNVLHLYNLTTRQLTNLGVAGSQPKIVGNRVYFNQREASLRKDLNGDRDTGDLVLSAMDLNTRQVESLGMEAEAGFEVAGDWIATLTRENGQANMDLNGDKDTADEVIQVYQISQKKWTSTKLEGSFGYALTPKLVAVGVDEAKQGNQDLNGDRDTTDVVAHVWDLTRAAATNLAQDCSGDIVADDTVVGMLTNEEAQGKQDLNGDKDVTDDIIQVWTQGSEKPVNVGRDGSGGIAAGSGKIIFAASEEAQGERDINGDRDAVDYVVMIYTPQANRILNTQTAVDGDLVVSEGYLAWKVLEADQGNRDLNRDMDMEDSVLYAMDLSTNGFATSSYASGDSLAASGLAIAFTVPEADQGGRDLNMDRDAEDDILHIARYKK